MHGYIYRTRRQEWRVELRRERERNKQKGKGEIVEGVDLTKRNACDQKEAGNPWTNQL